MSTTIIRRRGEGERMWFAGGGVFTWKATAAETDGTFLVFEDVMERGKVTPYHLHPAQDESFYVIEGEMLLNVDGEEHQVGSGSFLFAPRGVPHAFMVTSPTAHVLVLLTPGHCEDFYRACGEPADDEEAASRPADFARLRRVADASDAIEILGPPPFDVQRVLAGAAT